ncbi:MAG: acetoacetate decarboxylase [Bacteroidia bacterium]|nr:acetoacetate decarboxylase [Bacteroidia bacterium]
MTRDEILKQWAMPHTSPSYPLGPYRFINREYCIISYETDMAVIREILPEPLELPDLPHVHFEWIKMPDSAGFGDYTESGVVIPCRWHGEHCNFVVQMYLDDLSPIVAGREIWGFPKEYAHPVLRVEKDTLTGTLEYAGTRVATGTMEYKPAIWEYDDVVKSMQRTQINLKLIPHVDGSLAIAQLVAYNLTDITVKGAWKGKAALHLVPHVHAPVADIPIRKVIGGVHIIADLTLPYGRVIHDYLQDKQ